jgi:integrase
MTKERVSLSSSPITPDTVTSALNAYLATVRNQLKPSTYGIYEGYISRYISPYFGGIKCEQLTAQTVQGFVDRQTDNGLSAATVRSVYKFLRIGLRNVPQCGVISASLPKQFAGDVKVFTPDEQRQLESAARVSDSINHIGVTLSLYTGLRIGELCGLLWDDIDFSRRTLSVRRTIQRIKSDDGKRKTKVELLPPKSTALVRNIPLPDFLIDLLYAHKEQLDSDYVLSRDGKPIEPRNMQERFQKLLNTAGIKQANFHTTRHTFATRALENNFDVKTLSEILGHASASVTLNIYAHVLDEHKRKQMESLISVYQYGQNYGQEQRRTQ